jgi:carbamoyl-phosphate synthase large subunit
VVRKHFEGPDNIVDLINAGQVNMIINTPYGNPGPRVDGYEIRTAAVARGIPCITTVQGAAAAVQGVEALIRNTITVRPLQWLHAALRDVPPAAGSAGTSGAR